MAKMSSINKNNKRIKLSNKLYKKRKELTSLYTTTMLLYLGVGATAAADAAISIATKLLSCWY